MRRIELPPYTLRVRTTGTGTPVVLVHGLSGSARWWDRNAEALAREHEVHAVELAGFGSGRREAGATLPLPFDEAAALLGRWLRDELSEPAHVVGHSMGGQIAIELAARAPDRVRSLTLVASTGIPFSLAARDRAALLFRLPPRGLLSFAPRLAADALRAGPLSLGLASVLTLLGDAREAMRRVVAPTLLVWGDSDPLVPLRYARAMRDEIPRAELRVIPRAGHVPMWDQPDEFDGIVLGFFREAEAAPERAADAAADHFSWAIADCEGGICWRSSPGEPRVVLVHGLGIGSRYFRRLAAALHERGIAAVAPDLPGIAFSSGAAEVRSVPELADRLVAWRRDAAIGRALWVGHSTGCQLVEHVARRDRDGVGGIVHVGPVWTPRPLPFVRLPSLLALDALREPVGLITEAIRAYWDTGLLRIVKHMAAFERDLPTVPETPSAAIVGRRDPLVDRRRLAGFPIRIREIDGGHGTVWTHPDPVAGIIAETLASSG